MYIDCAFESWSTYHSVTASVIIPTDTFTDGTPSHKVKKKLPVLYLLHTETGDCTEWARYTAVERYANKYGIIVVMANCLDGKYRNVSIRFPGMPSDHGKFENYEALFTRELPDWVISNFPASDDMSDHYIAGASDGGYGALYYALKNPSAYSAVGLFEPKIFSDGTLLPELSSMIQSSDELSEIFLQHSEKSAVFGQYFTEYITPSACDKWAGYEAGLREFMKRIREGRE